MESKRIMPEGLLRNTPNEATVDTALLEAVNVRYKDGAWRQVGRKVVSANYLNIGEDSVIYHHPQSGKYICLVFRVDTWMVEAHVPGSTGGTYDTLFEIETITGSTITHVGNFIYISRSTVPDSYVLFWNDITGAYVRLPQIPDLKFAAGIDPDQSEERIKCYVDIDGLTSDEEKYNAVSGLFIKQIDDYKEKGFIGGHIFLRYAYKLYDGSYVMHSEPFYVNSIGLNADIDGVYQSRHQIREIIDTYGYVEAGHTYWQLFQLNYEADPLHFRTYYNLNTIKLYIDITNSLTSIQSYIDSNLIKSVCVFCSSITEGYTIATSYSGLDQSLWANTNMLLPVDKVGLKEMIDPASMFLIKEWEISELVDGEVTYVIPSFKDLELNEPISPDNFTHHQIVPTCQYTLNNKIHGGNIITDLSFPVSNVFRDPLSIPYIVAAPTGYKYYATVELLTDDGLKRKTVEIIEGFYVDLSDDIHIRLNHILIYPDIRAKSITFWALKVSDNSKKLIVKYNLTQSGYSNYSYHNAGYVDDNPDVIVISNLPLTYHAVQVDNADHTYFAGLTDYSGIIYDDLIHDYNRVQVSKLNNPFVWDANNSYRFGSERNTVSALCTAQEPITETVFGLYPVIVFTANGIYALERGTGDVMYSNVAELNKEVLSNPHGLLGVTGGVIFVTASGLKVLEGRQVSDIGIAVRGDTTNPILLSPYVTGAIPDTLIEEIVDLVSESFLDYIQDAVMGYSTVFNELILTKANADTSYVFSFDTKSWHTITESYSQILMTQGYYDGYFSDLNTESGSPVYFMQSRPMLLGTDGSKKINELLVRSKRDVLPNDYDQLFVFGSNDAATWVCIGKILVNADTNVLTLRNLIGHYRYISYMAIGRGESFVLTSIDVKYTIRYNHKLR